MKLLVFLFCLVALSVGGCSWIPRAGPSTSDVLEQGQAGGEILFDVVQVDDRVVNALIAQPKERFAASLQKGCAASRSQDRDRRYRLGADLGKRCGRAVQRSAAGSGSDRREVGDRAAGAGVAAAAEWTAGRIRDSAPANGNGPPAGGAAAECRRVVFDRGDRRGRRAAVCYDPGPGGRSRWCDQRALCRARAGGRPIAGGGAAGDRGATRREGARAAGPGNRQEKRGQCRDGAPKRVRAGELRRIR